MNQNKNPSSRAKQFLDYLKDHKFCFSVQKVIEETSMNKNIVYKVMAELKKTYQFTRQPLGIYLVTERNQDMDTVEKGEHGSVERDSFFEQLKAKGDSGWSATEIGIPLGTIRSRISFLRNRGHRIDYRNERYIYMGFGEFSICHVPGRGEKKVYGKKQANTPQIPIPQPMIVELFLVNSEKLKEALKSDSKEFVALIKDTIAKMEAANSAYKLLTQAKNIVKGAGVRNG